MITRTGVGTALVTAADARAYARVVGTTEDALLDQMILAATEYCESFTGRDVRANTYEALFDGFPGTSSTLTLDKSGVNAVLAVERMVSGAFVDFPSSSNWYVLRGLFCAEIELESGISWPVDLDRRRENVKVEFTTAAHPGVDACRQGILKHVTAMYADRGDDEMQRSEARGAGGGLSPGFVNVLASNSARTSGAEGMYLPWALVDI